MSGGTDAQSSTERVRAALRTATDALLAELGPEGHWTGELSSSALSTATAIVALSAVDGVAHADLIVGGRLWLAEHQNADGGWGDTIKSRSNISTTALCWGALGKSAAHAAAVARADQWLRGAAEDPGSTPAPGVGEGVPPSRTSFDAAFTKNNRPESSFRRFERSEKASRRLPEGGLRQQPPNAETSTRDGCAPRTLVRAIERRYGKDRTFSVPILMHLAICGRVNWQDVPRLPFELAALPHQLFGALQLPVVSYALPALIAIGQAIHHHRPTRNPLWRWIREQAIARTLRVLESIQPPNGGFLEATPLTSFVTMALASAGHAQHPVARKGVAFLRASAQPDGSWAIDTNLATWVTTLAIKALAPQISALSPEQRLTLREWLLGQQYRVEHPYTHAAPGGWAWTHLPGGVPDADDTPGALLALLELGSIEPTTRAAGIAGVRWLLDLQNRDGGIPTFCRGWGALPFDRSSPDLTAHTLRAWSAWQPQLDEALKSRTHRATERAVAFLAKQQRADGSWSPLWFGNEHAPDDENPLYGTTHIVLALRELRDRAWPLPPEMLTAGFRWLVAAQNTDGGWGGVRGAPSSVEETALAVEALALTEHVASVDRGVAWLVERIEAGTWREPSPIGFYFAKLWYYERLYPLIWTVGALGKAGGSGLG